jgi:tetratricopeptide (TPR) repeat protein
MSDPAALKPTRKKYVRAVGPRLRIFLYVIFALVALLGANSAYLVAIKILEKSTGNVYQNYFYQMMFLGHLVLGLLLLLPFIVFGIGHIKNSYNRPNRRAVSVGYALFAISIILLVSGIALVQVGGIKLNPNVRPPVYWAHVITPLLAVWLYILHRLAGPRIKWKVGLAWAGAVGVVVIGMVFLHAQDPRKWNVAGPKEGTKYFEPSLARTVSGNFIPAKTMMMDDYCLKCHEDSYKGWFHSAHHFSSFNNQPYLFSVRETRKVALQRDGNVKAARWCAGCHDVVPFFSGAFDDPNFDDVHDPTAQAGITCTACHAISHIDTTVGNASYTIDEPIHYPFAFSTNKALQFVNNQLIKAKPAFHKKTFLKPEVHKSAEFCSTCHKVSIPFALNHYKEFLRGQNSYDTYLLSGVSGHNARSFYYPPKAVENCAGCHMPLQKAQNDFGAKFFSTNDYLTVHNHLFPGANTGIAHLNNDPETVKAHSDFLKGTLRIDLFGIKDGGTVDSALIAPLRPRIPELKRGHKYLLETVLRTLSVGHPFTQGTADSNEIWVDAKLTSGGKVLGRSGGMGEFNAVDPWSHFVNVYMLDRNGNRIDRRNPQDIFTPLYNHQIPPGAAQVVHYEFAVPENQNEPLTVEVKLEYRKFDTTYMHYVFGNTVTNDLPIVTIASDKITFPVEGTSGGPTNETSTIEPWQRWNDYGIGLLLEGNIGSEKGELIQSEEAFAEVEKLGRADGPLNLARVYFKEGRLNDAVDALDRAVKFNPPAPRWTVTWLTGMVNKQNGYLDDAIKQFRSVLEDRYPELEQRQFDFSKDYEVINELGQTYFERSKLERANKAKQREFVDLAVKAFKKTLDLDSENLAAHYNLALIYQQLGDENLAAEHRRLHEKYRPDDNARDRAISIHRRQNPAADHAAQSIVIYNLQREASHFVSK